MTVSQAVNKMRLCRQQQIPFGLVFVSVQDCALRKIENAQLRAAPTSNNEKQATDHDAFIYFTDLDTNEPKQCRKRLIQQVRFGNIWYDIEI